MCTQSQTQFQILFSFLNFIIQTNEYLQHKEWMYMWTNQRIFCRRFLFLFSIFIKPAFLRLVYMIWKRNISSIYLHNATWFWINMMLKIRYTYFLNIILLSYSQVVIFAQTKLWCTELLKMLCEVSTIGFACWNLVHLHRMNYIQF